MGLFHGFSVMNLSNWNFYVLCFTHSSRRCWSSNKWKALFVSKIHFPWSFLFAQYKHWPLYHTSFSVCRSASKARRELSERTPWAFGLAEFSAILIYFVMSPLVSLNPLCLPFPFASNRSTYPEKLAAHECGSDPSGDARSRFDIRFYLVPILFIIPDPEVTFSSPWAVPPNKIDPFWSWSMMAFLLILTIGSLYEWKRGASDRE